MSTETLLLSNLEARIRKNLAQAIKTMRDACDEAERYAKEPDPGYAIQRVMHGMTWGNANASSFVECAVAANEELHAARKWEPQS